MGYIPLKEACDRLGVLNSTICVCKKYSPFYKKTEEGTRNAMFDVDGYKKRKELEESLTEKTKLLIEYLYHEKDVKYSEMEKITNIRVQAFSSLTFGFNTALKIVRIFADLRPFFIIHFDRYYGWRTAPIKRKKVLG